MKVAPANAFREILAFLRRLTEAKIHYSLSQCREDAIMVGIDVPGQRWEVEFVDYGDEVHVEVERFISSGDIGDESVLNTLFSDFSDMEIEPNESLSRS